MISVEHALGFRQDDVILVAMDRAGARALLAALEMTSRQGEAALSADAAAPPVRLIRADGPVAVELGDDITVWRLPPATLEEAIGKVGSLLEASAPAHHYIDLTLPPSTLVLSVDEYVPSSGPANSRELLTVRH